MSTYARYSPLAGGGGGGSGDVNQGGNIFGAPMVIGTLDENPLVLITDAQPRLSLGADDSTLAVPDSADNPLALTLRSGNPLSEVANGGNINLIAADGVGDIGGGGGVFVNCGGSFQSGPGGAIQLTAGDSQHSSPGDIILTAGSGNTTPGGNIVLSAGLSQSSNMGFLYIPSVDVAPTATPVSQGSNQVALVFSKADTSLYVYNGGWIKVALS